MSSRWLINFFLVIFVVGTLAALVKFTRVLDNGIGASWEEGVGNLKRIVWEPPPPSELSPSEKDRIVENLEQKRFAPFFCGSSYFPFIPGANWNYQVKSSGIASGVNGSGSDTVHLGIPAPENGRTYLDRQLLSRSGWTNRTIAICDQGKIHLTDLNFLLTFARDRVVTTPCQGGQYNFSLPKDADLIKGNGWLEDGCLAYDTLNDNNEKVPPEAKEYLEVKGKILGSEEVVVPAGSFAAVKIELALSGRTDVAGDWKTAESTLDFWAAQGVGVVRSVYQEKNSGRPAVVQELAGYQIPSASADNQPVK